MRGGRRSQGDEEEGAADDDRTKAQAARTQTLQSQPRRHDARLRQRGGKSDYVTMLRMRIFRVAWFLEILVFMQMPDQEINLEIDTKDIGFYSIDQGDTLLVKLDS